MSSRPCANRLRASALSSLFCAAATPAQSATTSGTRTMCGDRLRLDAAERKPDEERVARMDNRPINVRTFVLCQVVSAGARATFMRDQKGSAARSPATLPAGESIGLLFGLRAFGGP